MRLLTYSALLMAVLEAAIIAYALTNCLPDTQDRFFMGRGTHGQCLYAEGNARGEVK